MKTARAFILAMMLTACGGKPPPCGPDECTCAGTRHVNDTLYSYPCECCASAGCHPNPDKDLKPPKKKKIPLGVLQGMGLALAMVVLCRLWLPHTL